MAAILQIVGSVGSTTSVLDLNDNPAGIMISRPDGGSSQLSLAAVDASDAAMPVWSPLGGASTPEATTRTISVPVTLFSTTSDGLGTKVQTLNKLLNQPWVLRVRRSGATVDGWIRCYPTTPQLVTNVTGAHGGLVVQGVITAQTEPYAYGARVDKASTTVPLMNPSTAGAFVLDVSGVTGDAPTPVFVRCSDSALVGTAHATMFAVRRTGTPTNLAVSGLVWQAEDGTSTATGTVVSSPSVSNAQFSVGVGARWFYPAGYVTSDGLGRIQFTPTLSGAEAPGLYKLLMRVSRSTSDECTFYPYAGGTTFPMDAVVFPAGGTNLRTIDLGIVQLPAGQSQQMAAPTPSLLGAGTLPITVDMYRTSGSAASNIDVDYFLLVPCDEDMGVAYQSGAAAAGSWLTVDGYAQDVFLTNGDPFLSTTNALSASLKLDYVGGVPRLYPGLTNRLFIVGGFSSVTSPAITASAAFQVSYWPRYTWLP